MKNPLNLDKDEYNVKIHTSGSSSLSITDTYIVNKFSL